MSNKNKKMASVKDASKLLGLSEHALRMGIKNKTFPYIMIGKKYLFDIALLEMVLKEQAYKNIGLCYTDMIKEGRDIDNEKHNDNIL